MKLKKQTKNSIAYIAVFMSVFLPVVLSIQNWLNSESVTVIASTVPTTTPSPTPSGGQPEEKVEEEVVDNPEIEQIAKEIFDKDAELMLAIGKAESGLDNTKCHIDDVEHSCGWLMINLKVHKDKVPGDTLEDKQEFLTSSARDTAMVGRFIKATQGLRAWTVYNTGVYMNFLPAHEK